MSEAEAVLPDDLLTEQADPRHRDIDQISTAELARRMNSADAEVPAAVERALPAVASAVDAIVPRLAAGGRLVYVGAGTSGRLAVMDAAECPPTFNTEPDQVQAVVAGGASAVTGAVEGAEDDASAGAAAIAERDLRADDAVVGLTASGRAPFVLGAVGAAGRRGALTVGVSCNVDTPLSAVVDHAVEVPVGPEILAGSTRLKAGTAQKLVLNMISTIAMVRLGKTYGNLMVDLRVVNDKLVARAVRMVCEITGASPRVARQALESAGRDVKVAVAMIECDVETGPARAMLDEAGGKLALALRMRPKLP